MGVLCQILINKAKRGFFEAGQSVTGTVKYALDKPTEYKSVTLSFLGRGKCHWTEKSSKSSRSYTGTEEYTTVNLDLLNAKTDTVTLEVGTYEYPFEFIIPDDIPSSFKNDFSTCVINYRVQLKFVKAAKFSFNKEFYTDVPVRGFIEPTIEGPVIFGLDKTLLSLFSMETPGINLKAEIAKTCLLPAENVHLSLVVTNDSDVIPIVKTKLFCHTTYTADCGHQKKVVEKIKGCRSEKNEIPKRDVAKFRQTIPTNPDLYTINCKVMKKEYKVRVIVKLPMPHMNTFVEMPIAIGELKGALSGLGEEASAKPSEDMDEPPSYWEAMCSVDKEDPFAHCVHDNLHKVKL